MRQDLRDYTALDHIFGSNVGTSQVLSIETDEVFPHPDKRTFHVDRPGDYATAWGSSIHYQRYLYVLLRLARPLVVVETGVDWGVSTRFILAALKKNGAMSTLHSVDPSYANQFDAERTIESRLGPICGPWWRYYSDVATVSLPEVAASAPEWDVFIHDGDHGIFAQTFDYSFAWAYLKPGGFMVSDDFCWGRPTTRAWDTFCEHEGLDYYTIGNAAVVRKPMTCVSTQVGSIEEIHASCLALADAAEAEYDARTGGEGKDNRYPRKKW